MSKILYQNQLNYLSSIRPKQQDLIYEMENFARERKIPILDWKSAEFLEHIVMIKSPKRVLEIGTAIAYSSIRIARKLQSNSILDTIEKSSDNIKLAENFIKCAGLTKSINILAGDASEIMHGLVKKYDLIFLDADKEDYEKLFLLSLPLLKKNGIIFIDNLLWHGYVAAKSVPSSFKKSTELIRKFNKIFMNSDSLHTTILLVGDGIGLGIKK